MKPTLMDWGFASSTVAVSAVLNAIGGYLIVTDLVPDQYAAAGFVGSALFLLLEFAVIHAYVRLGKPHVALLAHALCVLALMADVQHVLHGEAVKVQETQQAKTQKQHEARQLVSKKLQLESRITAAENAQDAVLNVEVELEEAKNKRVRKGTVWTDSEHCTKDNHPKDCGKIRVLEVRLTTLKQKAKRFDLVKLRETLRQIDAKLLVSPLLQTETSLFQSETRAEKVKQEPEKVKQGNFSGLGVDKQMVLVSTNSELEKNSPNPIDNAPSNVHQSFIHSIKAVLFPNMSAGTWVMVVAAFLAVVLETTKAQSLSNFARHNRRNRPEKVKQGETRTVTTFETSVKQAKRQAPWFLRLVSPMAEKWAMFHATRSAELEAEKQDKVNAEIGARVDMHQYLVKLSYEEAAAWSAHHIDENLKPDVADRIKRTIFWALPTYEAGHPFKASGIIETIKSRVTEDTTFLNEPFMRRYAVKVMVDMGLIVNTGTAKRAAYKWATENTIADSFRNECRMA